MYAAYEPTNSYILGGDYQRRYEVARANGMLSEFWLDQYTIGFRLFHNAHVVHQLSRMGKMLLESCNYCFCRILRKNTNRARGNPFKLHIKA